MTPTAASICILGPVPNLIPDALPAEMIQAFLVRLYGKSGSMAPLSPVLPQTVAGQLRLRHRTPALRSLLRPTPPSPITTNCGGGILIALAFLASLISSLWLRYPRATTTGLHYLAWAAMRLPVC